MLTSLPSGKNPAQLRKALQAVAPDDNKWTLLVLRLFAYEVDGKLLSSANVVLAWRDSLVVAMDSRAMNFSQMCQVDAGFKDYIKAIYDNPAFCEEVIAQKDMDIRNGENIDTGWLK